MIPVWTAVKVIKPGAEREGTAGTVHSVRADKPDQVVVRFDVDNALVDVKVEDLQVLGG